MVVKGSVYRALLSEFPQVPPEAGAILGSDNGIISKYEFDLGIQVTEAAVYQPDVDRLNRIISDWAGDGTTFGGLVHSHPANQKMLSSADKAYIEAVMKAVPALNSTLYFPLVFPGQEIISFKAIKRAREIELLPDDIIIK